MRSAASLDLFSEPTLAVDLWAVLFTCLNSQDCQVPQRLTFMAEAHSQNLSADLFREEDTTFNIKVPKLLEGTDKHRSLL